MMHDQNDIGRWVPDAAVHPLTNIYGRKWRVVHLNGAITTGTYTGGGTGPDYRAAAEWFFPSKTPTTAAPE